MNSPRLHALANDVVDPNSGYYTYPPVHVTYADSPSHEHDSPAPSSIRITPSPFALSTILNPVPRNPSPTHFTTHPLDIYKQFLQTWMPDTLPAGYQYASPYHPTPITLYSVTKLYSEDFYADPIKIRVESCFIFSSPKILVYTARTTCITNYTLDTALLLDKAKNGKGLGFKPGFNFEDPSDEAELAQATQAVQDAIRDLRLCRDKVQKRLSRAQQRNAGHPQARSATGHAQAQEGPSNAPGFSAARAREASAIAQDASGPSNAGPSNAARLQEDPSGRSDPDSEERAMRDIFKKIETVGLRAAVIEAMREIVPLVNDFDKECLQTVLEVLEEEEEPS
ncbi:hypothetical protein C8R47DRAFT_1224018 [Mycena vitilis]|nr:hypothetical protein C8R47DRAFT_1224018 [Mycena vitilis]